MGAGSQTPTILSHLAAYGANAQAIIPQLEQIAQAMADNDAKKRERSRRHHDKLVHEAIEKIKASTKKPELIQIDVPKVGAR